MSFDYDPGSAILSGQLPDFLHHEVDIGIVAFLFGLAVDGFRHNLREVPGIRIEVDDYRLGQDLRTLGLDRTRTGGSELNLVIIGLIGVLGLCRELLNDREVHHLVERDLAPDHTDPAIQKVGGVVGPLKVSGVVAVQEEAAILGVIRPVSIPQHGQGLRFGHRVPVGHPAGNLGAAAISWHQRFRAPFPP